MKSYVCMGKICSLAFFSLCPPGRGPRTPHATLLQGDSTDDGEKGATIYRQPHRGLPVSIATEGYR